MSDESNSSDDYDGCGISPFSTSPNDTFYPACKRHDSRWLFSGPLKDPKRRAEINNEFLNDMINIVKFTGKWWLYPKAYAYFTLAKIFGPFSYD